MPEQIKSGSTIVALILRKNERAEDGAKFFTDTNNELQFGLLSHKKDYVINPHIHNDIKRQITRTQEVLHVQKGKVLAEFYDNRGKKVSESILNEGDTALLISCGHGFRMLEDSRIIEIKQGPYQNKGADKTVFEP
jgi:rRNA maturation protein Rpf1